MSAPRYQRGQSVAYVIRYGARLEKRHVGEVVEIGARGYRVRFENGREDMWLRAAQVRPVDSDEQPEATEAPSPKVPALTIVPLPVAPVVAAPATPSVDALEAAGVDPIAAWLELGRELLGRAQAQVEREERAVVAADAEVAVARDILALAERHAVEARDRLRVATTQRAEVERRTGGSR